MKQYIQISQIERGQTMKQWTNDEIQLIFKGLPKADIARITGRSMRAVEAKMYRLQGRTADLQPEAVKKAPSSMLSKETKHFRILSLAKRLGVRLKGEGK